MIRFKSFLEEEKKRSQSGSEHNDPKAKVNETETGLHLAKMHGIEHVDYRNEGEKATDVRASAGAKLPPEKHQAVVNHSQQLASAISDHLRDHHGIDLRHPKTNTAVAWTSQEGDIGKFTGHHESQQTNPSDIMVRHGSSVVGVSLKYGKSPGLRSPGHGDMQKMLNMHDADVHKIARMRGHIVERVGHELEKSGHITATKVKDKKAQYKALVKSHEEGTATPEQSKALTKAHGATNGIRSNMAAIYAQHFNSNSHETKTNFARRMLNAEATHHPMIKAHVNETNGKIHISDPQQEFNNFHSHVESYHAKHDGGTTFHIHAKMKDGTTQKVASVQFKHNSSVYSSVGASVGAAGAAVKKYGKAPHDNKV